LALTALLCALAGTSLLQIVPATAALKEVIIVKSLDAGFPPLIQEREPERLEIAPALTVRRELGDSGSPPPRERSAASRDRPLSAGPD
jgi:hypothetical protein